MKLASYKDGSRDGQLVVVSRDMVSAHYATGIADTLQQALDDWNFIAPQLQDLYVTLNHGKARHAFPFDVRMCMAPLPRGHWFEAQAYRGHLECQGASVQQGPWMVSGAGGKWLGPGDDVVVADEALDIDLGPGIAVVTGDVPQGVTPESALEGVRLLTLYNAVCLRGLAAQELQQGFGLLLSRPATALGPVAVTPDELGDAWAMGRLGLPLMCSWNGRKLGLCDLGEAHWHFGQLLAHLCRTRGLEAGTVLGAGTVSNAEAVESGGRHWPRGHGCLLEKRLAEVAQAGQPVTPYLKYGDQIRIEVKGKDGSSLFGAIEQVISPLD